MNQFFNIELAAFALFIFAFSYCLDLIRRQYFEYKSAKLKFKFFDIRDELAHLVLTGELDESSKEFVALRDAINYAISQVDNFSVRKAVSLAMNGIEKKDVLELKTEATRKIAFDYLVNMRKMIVINSRFELFVFSVLYNIFHLKSVNKNSPRDAVDCIDEKQKILGGAIAA